MPLMMTIKEPEQCDYLYIDENNKIHLLLPIVGGDEIALDNTCKTAFELRTFIHGTTNLSAREHLLEYKKNLIADLKALKTQNVISRYAYKDLIREKQQRLDQIEEYINLLNILSEKYAYSGDLPGLTDAIPKLPTAVHQILGSAQNAFAIRLAPDDTDPFTRFNNPVFKLKRNRSKYEMGGFMPLTEGLATRLRSTFLPLDNTPTLINIKSAKNKITETVTNAAKSIKLNGENIEQSLNDLKDLIEHELIKINPQLSVSKSRDNQDLNLEYLQRIMGIDDTSTIEEWIDAILTATVDDVFWDSQSTSVFDDGTNLINTKREADKLSIKVQFLLAEINFYCKTNKLSDADFGKYFDKEPRATEIAQLIKKGLGKGDNIESIIYGYINSNSNDLKLTAPLTHIQQKQITEKFTRNYNTIKGSSEFDEFLLMDPEKSGNIFSHQGRISCHFLDFFSRHTQGKCSLGGLEGHSEALQSKTPGRLNHKNEFVTQGYKKIQEFREQVLKQLADNNPRELLDYLVAKLPTGAPNYSMLSLETQNYISYNRNWPNIEKELMKPGNFQVNQQQELLKLLSRNNVNHENLSAITWSKYSSKPLIEIELKKIAEGLTDTVAAYKEKRARQWYKGIENMSRKQQCAELLTVAKKINTLLKSEPVSKELIYEKLVESINVLDRIDKEISSEEQNWFQSSLQKQINIFRNKLKEMCQLENYDFKSNNFDETITLEMAAQLNKINDPSIRAIMMKLPAHCHTDEAIHLFNNDERQL